MLRKELKRLVQQDPTISFLRLREDAFQWSEEEYKTTHRRTTTSAQETALAVNAHGVTADLMSQVLKALQEQQQSLQN